MSQNFRLPHGGLVDRDRRIQFTLDGKTFSGAEGDTLASALLANGQNVLGRSFKYHRPRGIMAAGSEDPGGLLTLGQGAGIVPNTRATMVRLFDGLVAKTQNAWPSVQFDIGAVNDLLSPFLGAGFYYKTFMLGGPYAWRTYEYFIRRAAGLGRASQEANPARFEKTNAHCDVLVVGGGPAGLAAALNAGRSGARVIIADEAVHLGGFLKSSTQARIDEGSAADWRAATIGELENLPNVRVLPMTTVFGLYDGQVAGLNQRFDAADPSALKERYWQVRAQKIILATGAIERPIAFANNDRPGVMLAGALLTYIREFGVLPGFEPLIFTNNDSAYSTALALAAAGTRRIILADSRTNVDPDLIASAKSVGVDIYLNHGVAGVQGTLGVRSATLVDLNSGTKQTVRCDLLGVSGGWSPTIHLASHRGTKPTWDEAQGCFLAGAPAPGASWELAGSVEGVRSLGQSLANGARSGAAAARECGFKGRAVLPAVSGEQSQEQSNFWAVPAAKMARGKAFIDFQHDVTTKDVNQAVQEGFLSPEHMKRYTTLGMATDQGKLSNTTGQALLAQAQDKPIEQVGTTTYRPPFTPVSLGSFAGRDLSEAYVPVRATPLVSWHQANGANMIEASDWRRPLTYIRGVENLSDSARREAFNVREHVGLTDVSSLGKIDVQGPDAATFLDLVYVNRISTLKIGKCRYGLMLREDGLVLDDGTVSRLSQNQFFMTTTTVEAGHVMAHLEHLLQVEFPELEVHVTSVSDVWGGMALAGPKSRAVLESLLGETAVSDEALPFMGFVEIEIAQIPARLHRISFSGELAFEIYAPPRGCVAIWQALLSAGDAYNIDVYGLEALDMLRIEKGHPTGNEIDGRSTLEMLSLAHMAKPKKDFIGRKLRMREAFQAATAPTLVGLIPLVPDTPLQGGAHLVREPVQWNMHDQLGRVSSAGYSTTHGRYVGIGFLRGGLEKWEGKTLFVADPVRGMHFEARVVNPVHVDPEGERVRG